MERVRGNEGRKKGKDREVESEERRRAEWERELKLILIGGLESSREYRKRESKNKVM